MANDDYGNGEESRGAENRNSEKTRKKEAKSNLRRHQSSSYSQPEGSRGTSTTPRMGTHPVVFQGQNGPVKTLHYERDDRSVVTSHDVTFQLPTHVTSDTSSDT